MNNPFDYTPDAACDEAFGRLLRMLDEIKSSDKPVDIDLCRELEGGKMLGVLIAVDNNGMRHEIYAFSGQIGASGFHHPLFVEPVFDYLQRDGYFKTNERRISLQNREIALFETGKLAELERSYEIMKARLDADVEEYKEKCKNSKAERAKRRANGICSEADKASMIRQSQFEKAELRRLKERVAAALDPFASELQASKDRLASLKRKRRMESEALQKWLFDNFRLLNARGESRSVGEIFVQTPLKIPPTGAGECCAPKLLHAAYLRGWHPVSMAEYWYGKSKGGEVREHGEYYPACRGKCLPILGWMLGGLDVEPPLDGQSQVLTVHEPTIIYENHRFCVVDKPSGMLSVPGKGVAISVQQWLEERYGADRVVKMAHRLDQDTSGLLIATFGDRSYKEMQSLFATWRVKKTYVAELECRPGESVCLSSGRIELPLSADWLDRPRQRVDVENGKDAVTDYEIIRVLDGRARVVFHPLTGRTHQLRVHAASEMGLGMPIAGDRLYGKNGGRGAPRLLLHAHKIEFVFPEDGRHYSFESPVPF